MKLLENEEYKSALAKIKSYWGYGDTTKFVDQFGKYSLKSKSYIKNRVSQVLNGKVEDVNLLLSMYEYVKGRMDKLKEISNG